MVEKEVAQSIMSKAEEILKNVSLYDLIQITIKGNENKEYEGRTVSNRNGTHF
jgi:hypothetical protein